MKKYLSLANLSLLALMSVSVPYSAQAHRAWMLPSATVISGEQPWVTVDAAVSNDLFYFEHQPLKLADISAFAPDGNKVKLENASTGRYRSTFDVKLEQKGTYKIVRSTETIMASYTQNGELKRFRGDAATFSRDVPANAPDLKVAKNSGRLEVFVTSGKPTTQNLQPTGKGLELVPITHPNDLFVGELASFKLVLDGKPAANVDVTAVAGGIRYRNQLQEIKVSTDADGKFTVPFKEPGMYWVTASAGDARPQGGQGGPNAPVVPANRASYTAVLEVLPQ